MKCPYCKKDEDNVVDSRLSEDGFSIRRRRECTACGRRHTTYERVEALPLHVVKKDGAREPFNRQKILNGLMKACEKRPIPMERIDKVVTKIEIEISDTFNREVPSKEIGELLMKELKKLDQVAYVRFASVYQEFEDIRAFMSEVKPMLKNIKPSKKSAST